GADVENALARAQVEDLQRRASLRDHVGCHIDGFDLARGLRIEELGAAAHRSGLLASDKVAVEGALAAGGIRSSYAFDDAAQAPFASPQSSIGILLPRIGWLPRFSNPARMASPPSRRTADTTASLATISRWSERLAASIRLARFTVWPTAVNSNRRSLPTSPSVTGPKCRPTL